MSNDKQMILVSLDGLWEINEIIELGTVRKFEEGCGCPCGWAFAHKHYTDYNRGVPTQKTLFIGARISAVPARTFMLDGEDYVDEFPNYGIEEKWIEAAVRHTAKNKIDALQQPPA